MSKHAKFAHFSHLPFYSRLLQDFHTLVCAARLARKIHYIVIGLTHETYSESSDVVVNKKMPRLFFAGCISDTALAIAVFARV